MLKGIAYLWGQLSQCCQSSSPRAGPWHIQDHNTYNFFLSILMMWTEECGEIGVFLQDP